MRAINLIPPEARGDRPPARTGALAYVVVAGLALALAGVTAVVMTGNSINDKKAEVATLQARQTQLQGEIARVQSYADLAALEQNRVATVTSLAESRFDWSRTLRELALLVPNDVWLNDLEGSVIGTGDSGSSATSSAAAQVVGPSLVLSGCASGHEAVAGFLDVLRDMDGVTRVGLTSSDRGGSSPSSGASASGSSAASCSVRSFIATFKITVAFDPVATPAATATAPTSASSTTATSDEGGVAGAQSQEQQVRDSENKGRTKAHDAVNAIIPGAVGG